VSVGPKSLNRCAIYTRKSSEEGLEQSFNSLDAQREACQAYIQSQRQEGWRALAAHYDDGGFSGGSMERPALRRLMADIEASRIDTVVVYKVDRLTRSLADFAKIVEAFDARGVSFVSVTQQFNTTTSMGRLTLNVLLSFAQFEREVTGERIRDKIAASKRKGMWMGGRVPLGYDLKDRHLIANREEAEHVREIFAVYLELGCVKRMKARLDERGTRSKVRISAAGVRSGGEPYSRGALYKILRNRLYLGEIPHKGESHPGEHAAIIDRDLWDRVQAKLKENALACRHGTNASAPSLLRGLVYDPDGHRFTPSHAVKNGKRYRYYVSQRVIRGEIAHSATVNRIPARDLESAALSQIRGFLGSADQLLSTLTPEGGDVATTRSLLSAAHKLAKELDGNHTAAGNELLAGIGCSVVVRRDSLQIVLPKHQLRIRLLGAGYQSVSSEVDDTKDAVTLSVPCSLKRCGGEMRMILPAQPSDTGKPVTSLLKAVSRAHDWVRRIESGEFKDLRAIATVTGLDERYVSHILPSAFLAPKIVEMIVEGKQSPDLSLNELLRDIPLDWTLQATKLQPAGNVETYR
jgi:site-specific DNA recombinase